MKAMFVNGSPRKKHNTARLLEAAMAGAAEAGAETELVHLFDYEFTGCRSCFACKLKNSKTEGICAIRDTLRPILERAVDSDVLVLGSPVYFSYPTGQLRSFVERLLFPNMAYLVDAEGKKVDVARRHIRTGVIYTMNCPEELAVKIGYPPLLQGTADSLETVFGYSEVLCAYDTYQFDNYDRYEAILFSEEHKRAWREQQFPKDLEAARAMGRRLTEMAAAL